MSSGDLLFSRAHCWVRDEGDVVVVGITDYAQEMLTDIVFVELPAIGKVVRQMDPFAVVESVKSVSGAACASGAVWAAGAGLSPAGGKTSPRAGGMEG